VLLQNGIINQNGGNKLFEGMKQMYHRRQHSRVRSNSPCIIVEPNGGSHQASIENVSVGGVLVAVNDGVPHSLNVDDVCDVVLFNYSEVFSTKRSCRVVRCDSAKMGIQFLSTKK
jgi:hypothetical protein